MRGSLRLIWLSICLSLAVIFASVLLSQVKKFFNPSKENVGATHKEKSQCTYVKD